MAKKIILPAVLWAGVIAMVQGQCSTYNITGNVIIAADTSWSAGAYTITGDFTVNSGATLTVVNTNTIYNCAFTINASNINILGTIDADGAGGPGGAGGSYGQSSGGPGGNNEACGGNAGEAGAGMGGGTAGNNGGCASGGCHIDCGTACIDGNDADRAGGGGGSGGSGGSHGNTGGAGGSGANGRIEDEPSNSDCPIAPVGGSGAAGNSAPAVYDTVADFTDLNAGSGGGGGGGGGGGFDTGFSGLAGGNGGGTVNLDASGNLTVSGSITANGLDGSAGGNGGIRSGNAANWNCEDCSNSGGGGANDCRNASDCGACYYYTWSWPGGAGGGAGGGSGGGIKLQAVGAMSITGSLQANGGSGGSAGHPWTSDGSCNNYAQGGGAGSGGIIKFVYAPCEANVFTPASVEVAAGSPGIGTDGNLGSNSAGNGIIYNQSADIYAPGYIPFLTPTAGANQSFCAGNTPTDLNAGPEVGGTGTYSYQWFYSTSDSIGQTGSNSGPAAGWTAIAGAVGATLSSGLMGTIDSTTYYQVQVQTGPCYAWSNVVTITILPGPTFSNVAVGDISCDSIDNGNGSIVVTLSGAHSPYTYSDNGGISFQNNGTFGSLSAGDYNLYAVDANNCLSIYARNPVVISEAPGISQTDAADNATCLGLSNGVIIVTASGGTPPFRYSLNGNANQVSNIFREVPWGVYYVKVTDSAGCSSVESVTVNYTDTVTASIISQTNVLCYGDSNGQAALQLSGGTPAYSYSLNGFSFVRSDTVSRLAPGNYMVTIRDSAGCLDYLTLSVSRPSALQVELDTVQPVCGTGGSATVIPSGGTLPYSYLWSNNDTTSIISNITTGAYAVTVYDANQCSQVDSFTLLGQSPVSVSFTTTSDSCYGYANGTALANAVGGAMPYLFVWSNGDSTATINNLFAGTYTVTVTDSNNCSASASVAVYQPNQLLVSTSSTTVDSAGQFVATATVNNITGGTQPYSVRWSNGLTGNTITGLSAGTYTAYITDSNGCEVITTVTVSVPTGINSLNSNNDLFSVYPNPAKTELVIDLLQPAITAALTIKNTLGQTVLVKTLSQSQNILNISDFADGVYMIEVAQGDKRMVKEVVVSGK